MSHAAPQSSAATAGEALREGVRRLETAGVPSAALAAELLLLHTLGRDRAWLYAHPEHMLDALQSENFFALLDQRAAGVPTQYLTGKQEFWGLDFEVTPAVLIPRSETEHIVEVSLARLGNSRRNSSLLVAEVGTGSGCIAVALAKELPRAKLFATDISRDALAVARRNTERHGVAHRIQLIECNLLEGVSTSAQDSSDMPVALDLVVSNPPYVAQRDAETLPLDVRKHEPAIALFAGDDGLSLYPTLIAQAGLHLKPGGLLVMELGLGQFESVGEMLDASRGWTNVSAMQDLAGIIRVISAVRG